MGTSNIAYFGWTPCIPNREGKAISSRRSRRKRRRRHILWKKLSIHHFRKEKREKAPSLSLSLVEDTLHTFGWCLKGPGGSNRICSSSSPHLGLHPYILSGEGLRGMGSGDMRTRQVCPNFSRTHMHQDVIEAKKKGKSSAPKNRVDCSASRLAVWRNVSA